MQDDDEGTIDSHELPPGEERIFRALGELKPRRPALDARAIMAEAALRHERRRVWLWRGVSGALAASLLVVVWGHHPTNEHDARGPSATHVEILSTEPSEHASHERNAFAEARKPETSRPSITSRALLTGDDYFAVRDRLDLFGLSGLSLGANERRPASSSAPGGSDVPPVRAMRPMPMRSGATAPAGPVSQLLRWLEPGEQI